MMGAPCEGTWRATTARPGQLAPCPVCSSAETVALDPWDVPVIGAHAPMVTGRGVHGPVCYGQPAGSDCVCGLADAPVDPVVAAHGAAIAILRQLVAAEATREEAGR